MEIALQHYPDVEIVFEDDQSFEKTRAVNAAKKLTSSDKVEIVFNGAVNTAHAISPILQQQKIPGIVIWDNNRSLNKMGPHMFSIGFSTERAAEDMAHHAFDTLGLKKVAILSAQDEWSEMIAGAFRSAFLALGGTVTADVQVLDHETDMRASLTKMINSGAQGIHGPLNPPVVNNFIRQARNLGFPGILMVADGFADGEISDLKSLSEGIYVTQMWVKNKDLASLYTQMFRTKTTPINLGFVGLGFDAVKLAHEIHTRSHGRRSLLALLPTIEIEGMTGVSKLTKSGMTSKREPIMKIQQESFVPVEVPNT